MGYSLNAPVQPARPRGELAGASRAQPWLLIAFRDTMPCLGLQCEVRRACAPHRAESEFREGDVSLANPVRNPARPAAANP